MRFSTSRQTWICMVLKPQCNKIILQLRPRLRFFGGEDLKAYIYVSPLHVTTGGEKNKILRKILKSNIMKWLCIQRRIISHNNSGAGHKNSPKKKSTASTHEQGMKAYRHLFRMLAQFSSSASMQTR